MPKIEILKFLVLLTIFSLAVFNILSIKKIIISKQKYVLFFAILFGFFNGLGSSIDVLFQLEWNESEFLSIIGVVLGAGAFVLLISLCLLIIFALLRKLPKLDTRKLTLAFSIIIVGLSIPLIVSQIFN